MNNIILHPSHPDYCKRCIYCDRDGMCKSKEYQKNSYYVVCVLKRCIYRKERGEQE